MSVELICELATAHGGNVQLAEDMIAAAADAGAHTVKVQSYTLARLNPRDPQAEWLTQAHLDEAAHERLMKACERNKVQFLSTPFDADSFVMLWKLGQRRFKAASIGKVGLEGEWIKSWPWGRKEHSIGNITTHLTAIPLYPTPLECVGQAQLLDGYSDHCEGIDAARYMVAKGAKILEVHMCLPGRSRQMSFDKTPSDIVLLRRWIDEVETMTSGVSTQFRTRWSA